jgi:glucose-fructose oxidoreductase
MKATRHSTPLSRRQFVGHLAVGASALALGSKSFAQSVPPRKLGLAIVGLGGYATGQLAPALKTTKNIELRGVVTGSPEKGKKWAQEFGFPETSIYNYQTMPRLADNRDIDIVYVVTPNALHAEEVITAAKAGKHVISEKPFTTSVADAEAAIAACQAAKVKLSIGYRLHFDPFHQELKRLAREKDFGVLAKMTGANGFRMGRKVWRADKKLAGGGPLMDMGIYCVQAACMAADGATPVAVTAREHPKTRPEIFSDVEEGLDWTMEFADGSKAELMSSYSQNVGRFRAEGAGGWINLDPAFGYRGIRLTKSSGMVNFAELPSQQAVQMDDFAQCVREGRESRVSGEMGLRDMKIIAAIYEAMKTGKRTRVQA